jgi:hypothetical protein
MQTQAGARPFYVVHAMMAFAVAARVEQIESIRRRRRIERRRPRDAGLYGAQRESISHESAKF